MAEEIRTRSAAGRRVVRSDRLRSTASPQVPAHMPGRRHRDGRVSRDSSQMACGQEYGNQQA